MFIREGDRQMTETLPTYSIEVRKLTYVRGWPQASTKPFLVYRDNAFVAGFATKEKANTYITRKTLGLDRPLSAEDKKLIADILA